MGVEEIAVLLRKRENINKLTEKVELLDSKKKAEKNDLKSPVNNSHDSVQK